MATCREIFTFSWPLLGRGGGGQPKRSAWPLFPSFFLWTLPLPQLNKNYYWVVKCDWRKKKYLCQIKWANRNSISLRKCSIISKGRAVISPQDIVVIIVIFLGCDQTKPWYIPVQPLHPFFQSIWSAHTFSWPNPFMWTGNPFIWT